MSIEVRWIASLPASALHAALAIDEQRRFVDVELADALRPTATRLQSMAHEIAARPDSLLPTLAALAAGIPNPTELADIGLRKSIGPSAATQHVRRLVDVVRQLIADFQRRVPDVLEQLELRGGPIRQQWDARGLGLLKRIGELTDPALLVSQAQIVLAHPVLGGACRSFLPYNSVLFEAVVADPVAALPEVIRLAFGIAQLHCDLPEHQGELQRDQLSRLAALAMIPATLSAGEELELTRCDLPTIQEAVANWVWPPAPDVAKLAGQLHAWWGTYSATRPRWTVAIAALQAMVVA